MQKRFLFVVRRPPYADVRSRETVDMILTVAAFDQPVTVLFLDDGVLQLKKGQQPERQGIPPVAPLLETLDLYDVREVWAERESLAERGLGADDLTIPVRIVSRRGVAALTAAQDVVIGS